MVSLKSFARVALSLGTASLLSFAVASPAFADDVTGTSTLTGGALSMSAVDAPAVSGTLAGTNLTLSDTFNISVDDLSGTGAGWKLQMTSTTFTTVGGKTLANTASSITGVTFAANGAGTYVNPTNSVTYGALTVPAAATAPAAVSIYNAAADSGMGKFTITPTIQVLIPANAYAGTYSSTMTLSIVAGP